jgi:integrase
MAGDRRRVDLPARKRPSRPITKDAARSMWQRLAARAGIPLGERYGWHALRRRFATELEAEPLKDVCELGGWRNPATLLEAYQKGDEATQRAALARRRKLSAAGLT